MNSSTVIPSHRKTIDACFDCASACWISANALLDEKNAENLKHYIQKSLSVAENCTKLAQALIDIDGFRNKNLEFEILNCMNIASSVPAAVNKFPTHVRVFSTIHPKGQNGPWDEDYLNSLTTRMELFLDW